MAGDEFGELLGQLKERSGLSYGVLGKRLHMSASTLHRYVNGDAVPTDYAPVERLARVCRATPEELVELHRRWVLADALRRQRPSGGAAGAGREAAAGEEPAAAVEAPAAVASEGVREESPGAAGPDDLLVSPRVTSPGSRRRRTVVLAGAAVAAAVVSVALVARVVAGDGGDGDQRADGALASADDRPRAGASAGAKGKSASPSASRSARSSVSAAPSASRSGGGAGAAGAGGVAGATAPVVAVNPYKWDGPCSQHYLIDREPEKVPPPPSEPDARGWVNALGGVAAGQQMLALTVQGSGKATVVLDDLHVRVVDKSAPLAWNDFAMGVGCGGGVETTSFAVNLDDGRPDTSPRAGQRDFPYKVSESDPEVFYIFADARTYNVSWYLELEWSSGGKKGTVRVDDDGKPFRTSGNVGRPAYDFPLGDSAWGRDPYEPDVRG
ncbi:helix-turn-helix domain-containing protein [Streptomyces ortus]|uniref:Helix-turn-helix domain-containing protein n=1 Tax=Streptomyces ortus TaxID=2867268 RepID=A0ABT3V7J5_9ACTN|nr:helix-turn-helix transcriptional regulator [Streptomyces ortus]MCX4235940.1 helix-turn-helix domain-containing protein [Streptomyces ortus]